MHDTALKYKYISHRGFYTKKENHKALLCQNAKLNIPLS